MWRAISAAMICRLWARTSNAARASVSHCSWGNSTQSAAVFSCSRATRPPATRGGSGGVATVGRPPRRACGGEASCQRRRGRVEHLGGQVAVGHGASGVRLPLEQRQPLGRSILECGGSGISVRAIGRPRSGIASSNTAGRRSGVAVAYAAEPLRVVNGSGRWCYSARVGLEAPDGARSPPSAQLWASSSPHDRPRACGHGCLCSASVWPSWPRSRSTAPTCSSTRVARRPVGRSPPAAGHPAEGCCARACGSRARRPARSARCCTSRRSATAPFSLVQAFTAGGLALTVPVAARAFGQRLGRAERLAVAVLVAALSLLGLGAGSLVARAIPAAGSRGRWGRGAGGRRVWRCPRAGRAARTAAGGGRRRPLRRADATTKAVTMTHGGLIAAVTSPWLVVLVLLCVAAFACFQRGLQIGPAVPVIAMMTGATNAVAIVDRPARVRRAARRGPGLRGDASRGVRARGGGRGDARPRAGPAGARRSAGARRNRAGTRSHAPRRARRAARAGGA